MSDKNKDWKDSLPLMFCTIIIAVGFIIAALIFANAIADRPMQGNFSGSISSGSFTYPDLMEIDDLRQYLGIYPAYEENYGESLDENYAQSHEENYEELISKLQSDLESSILNGDWPGFPYVQISDRLYFSKQAVNDWFAEQGKQQLRIQ